MAFPFGETITIVRQIVDRYGDRRAGISTVVEGCAVYPASVAATGTEITRGQDLVTWDLTALVPPATDVRATDRVLYAGTLYDVTGQPTPWRSVHTGWSPGIELHLTASTG